MSMIQESEALQAFCEHAADAEWLALDTEFLREKTYFPQLCLIQLATAEQAVCIDPLADLDLMPLIELLQNPAQIKIIHAPGQDLEILYQQFGKIPAPLFDTQLAAAFLGMAEQIGYADLVARLTDTRLAKQHSRSDWSRRPLSEAEMEYALDDVRYLGEVYEKLHQQLQQRDRLPWMEAAMQYWYDSARYEPQWARLWMKLKGWQKLKGIGLCRADQLARWREQVAIDKNRPKRWIMADEVLLDIARQGPKERKSLQRIRGFNAELDQRFGETILSILASCEQIPKDQWPVAPLKQKLAAADAASVDAMQAITRLVADQHQLSPNLLTNRQGLEQLYNGDESGELLQGWRAQLLGQVLKRYLDGEVQLKQGHNGLELVLA